MKNATVYSKRFAGLRKQIMAKHRAERPEVTEPVAQLVTAFLEWNASRQSAEAAHVRLMEVLVDYNDLRVSFPHEVAGILGSRYPQAAERAERMHDALQDIFMREQVVSMDALSRFGKKEVREYLDGLSGMHPYIAAQVTLLCYGGHAVPVDDQLVSLLKNAEVVSTDATLREVESFLERQIKADKAVETHLALRAWVDAGSQRAWTRTKKAAKSRAKKITKKKKTKVATRR